MYRKEVSNLHPEFQVYHLSESVSRLYFRLNPEEFIFTRMGDEGTYKAVINISFALYTSLQSKSATDTGSFRLERIQTDTSKYASGYCDFKTPQLLDYILDINLYDRNRNTFTKRLITIDKNNPNTRQHFNLTNELGQPIFRNYIEKNEKLWLSLRDTSLKKLFVHFYQRDFPLPLPPFSIDPPKPFNAQPDSAFSLISNGNVPIKFSKEGFYHIMPDTLSKNGITLFCFSEGFPRINSQINLLQPLRYLTSKKEFEDLFNNKNIKKSIDQFWLTAGGTPERSKALIKNYYGRVQEANTYFSSYIEGWKTDRGMIYIIMGAPKFVNRTASSETWIYNKNNHQPSATFTFYKVGNPFSDNDYGLSRSLIYENLWYNAVKQWKEGWIYN